MIRQAAIRVVGEIARDEMFQFASQRQAMIAQFIRAQAMAAPGSAQRERAIDQRQHGAGKARGASVPGLSKVALRHRQQFLATTLQVPQALLMRGAREAVVHAPASWIIVPDQSRPSRRSAMSPLRSPIS